jgi:single-stranded-DNA-specific exonuclease
MLVVGLRRALREIGWFSARPEPDLRNLLDLVAVATVADMVPMRGQNRILVAAGLKRMRSGGRLGLHALMEVAGVVPANVGVADLGFRLGPRINARGRLSHAGAGVELLLTQDPAEAKQLAATLDAANRERQALERATVESAAARVERDGLLDGAAIVIHDNAWHPGVLGLVATRLVGTFNRPAIVIGEGGKGSGRTVPGLDLHAAIGAASEHLVRFGGHAAAAGVTIEPEHIGAFRTSFEQAVRGRLGAPPFVATLSPDLEVPVEELSLDMLGALERLQPFGQENPEPLWVSRQVAVRDARLVGDTHLKLQVGGHDAIAFGLGRLLGNLPERLDVAFRLERNVYRGRVGLQLRVEDLRASPV